MDKPVTMSRELVALYLAYRSRDWPADQALRRAERDLGVQRG
jgi:hypothetical protein